MTQPQEPPVLKSRRRPDVSTTIVAVGNVRFGDGSYPVVAGPVAVESEEQIMAAARAIADAGGSMLRAGVYAAEDSPYAFHGLGEEGLWMLERAGHETELPTVTAVPEPAAIETLMGHVDMLEVGPQHMQDFVLLREVGRSMMPVLLHRGPSATVDEWLMAAEYVLAEGNDQVVLVERGSRGFDPRTSDTLDISAVPVVQRLTHLPVAVAPAMARAGAELVTPLALAGRSVGADALIVGVHPDPVTARAGNGSQLDSEAFGKLMEALGIPSLRDEIDRIDRELIKLVARRLHASVEIAKIKAERGLPMRSPDREAELIAEAKADAERLGIDGSYIAELLETVLEHSRRAQRNAVGERGDASHLT